jgi:hypothetical protein
MQWARVPGLRRSEAVTVRARVEQRLNSILTMRFWLRIFAERQPLRVLTPQCLLVAPVLSDHSENASVSRQKDLFTSPSCGYANSSGANEDSD